MYEFLEYRVRDFMSAPAVTVERSAILAEAERIFEERDFDCLPVVENGRIVGVLSKLDFLAAFAFTPASIVPPYEELMRRTVGESMKAQVIAAAPDDPLTRVLDRLVRTRHKSLPVLRGDELLGVISRSDVLRALRHAACGEKAGARA